MKRLLFFVTGIFASLFTFSQTYTEEVDFFQALYGMEKKAIVEEFVQPATSNRVLFWEIYDEYELKRKELGKQRIDLLVELDAKFANLSNEDAEAWMKKVIALGKSHDKLIETYYRKMLKAISPIVAMRFYMLEAYLLTAIRYEILDAIPFPQEVE